MTGKKINIAVEQTPGNNFNWNKDGFFSDTFRLVYGQSELFYYRTVDVN
jgi:hypothetical protein